MIVPTDKKKKTVPDPIDGRSRKSWIPHTMKPVPGAIDNPRCGWPEATRH